LSVIDDLTGASNLIAADDLGDELSDTEPEPIGRIRSRADEQARACAPLAQGNAQADPIALGARG